jgi:hypothetical protein
METLITERSRVWQAITEPERFSKWFGCNIQFARYDSNNEGWDIQLNNIAEYLRTTNHV